MTDRVLAIWAVIPDDLVWLALAGVAVWLGSGRRSRERGAGETALLLGVPAILLIGLGLAALLRPQLVYLALPWSAWSSWLTAAVALLLPALPPNRRLRSGGIVRPVARRGALCLLVLLPSAGALHRASELPDLERSAREHLEELAPLAGLAELERRLTAGIADTHRFEVLAEELDAVQGGWYRRQLRRPRAAVMREIEQRRLRLDEAGLPTAWRPATTWAPTARAGTCLAVRRGQGADAVRQLLGPPDLRISAEDVRGPGAERWVFRELLCQVHMVDGIVEAVS